MMNVDMELVRAYADGRSEQAFATLVTRYVNFVYSTALRQVRDPHLAEEITQAVFVVLARKAGTLGADTILPGWLHRTAGYCAADALKMQRRREQREQEAYMQSQLNEPENETWLQIAPLLDKAIAGLSEKDRDAIVLRFFQNKSLNEVGVVLGASEEAAKKRVARAVDRLRAYFFRRGVNSTAETIAGAISANSVIVAPAALAKTATAMALAKGGATASASTAALTKGALNVMAWTHVHTAIAVGAAVLLAAGTTAMVVHRGEQVKVPVELPKTSWAFAGYGSPADTIETIEWAASQMNAKALLDGISADCQEDFRQYLAQNKPGVTVEQYFLKDMAPDQGHVSDVGIVNTEELSPNQILVELSFRGSSAPGDKWLKLKKFGDNWLIDDFDPKGPNGRTGLEHSNARYGGIGIALDLAPGTQTPRIAKVLPALSQSQTNLYSGLIVEKINGTAVAGKKLSECIFLTRGRINTDVVLQLYDQEHKQTNIVELTRKQFTGKDMTTLGLR
jgi:RNA polymerase sigma factor (sigma-70 family)